MQELNQIAEFLKIISDPRTWVAGAVVFMTVFSVWYQKTQRVIDLLEDIKDNTRVPALGKKEEAVVTSAPARSPEGSKIRSLLNSGRAEQIVGLLVITIVLLVLYFFNQARFDSFFEGIF